MEGRGEKRKGNREAREKGEGKEGKIVEENLKLKGERERYENEQQRTFFFSLLETTKICLGCTKMEILGGNFLTSPTFDCTPGYTSGQYYSCLLNNELI